LTAADPLCFGVVRRHGAEGKQSHQTERRCPARYRAGSTSKSIDDLRVHKKPLSVSQGVARIARYSIRTKHYGQ
jgi:hypothetical protein